MNAAGSRVGLLVAGALLALATTASAQSGGSAPADSVFGSADSQTLESLRGRLRGSDLTSSFTGLLFSDVPDSLPETDERVDETARFRPWEGRTVRRILVGRLNPLSATPVGSPGEGLPRLARWGNAVHLDTHEPVIRAFILAEEGEPLDPRQLADTERLLRQTAFIYDASIEVLEVEHSDEVDLLVVTRDRWSIGARYTPKTVERHSVSLFDRNLFGWGLNWDNRFEIDTSRPDEPAEYTGTLSRQNWQGTFVDTEIRYAHRIREENTAVRVGRTADLPEVATLGHVILEWNRVRDEDVRRWEYADYWLGRALRVGVDSTGRVSRLLVHGRYYRQDFQRRPPVDELFNRAYHERKTWLASVAVSARDYRTLRLVRGWGRPEDIPLGHRFSVVGGYRDGEFEDRPYVGAELTGASFRGNGYVLWVVEGGGFLRDAKMEDAALNLFLGGFGPLLSWGRTRTRPLASFLFSTGFRRLEGGTVDLGTSRLLTGVSTTAVPGNAKLGGIVESTTFTPLAPWGFRLALFGQAGVVTAAAQPRWIARNRWYTSFTIGLRIFNELLVFDPLEISVSFYPSLPADTDGDTLYFGSSRRLEIPGFGVEPPRVVEVR